LPATVISLTGQAISPFSNQKPETPADQSPPPSVAALSH
jgi:hypothetical protein